MLSLKDSCDFLVEVSSNTSQVLSRSVIPFAVPIPPPSLCVAVLILISPYSDQPLFWIFWIGPGCKNGTVWLRTFAWPICKPGFLFCIPESKHRDLEFPSFDPKRSILDSPLWVWKAFPLSQRNILELPFPLTLSLPLPPFSLDSDRNKGWRMTQGRVQMILRPSISTFLFFIHGNCGSGRGDN